MARCGIRNPRKLRRIARLLNREVVGGFYRGGWHSKEFGHFFHIYCADGTAWYVDSRLTKFEQDNEPWPRVILRKRDGTEFLWEATPIVLP